MSDSTWIKITQVCLFGASICILYATYTTGPVQSDKPDVISQAIDDGISDMVQRKSFNNVMRAMQE